MNIVCRSDTSAEIELVKRISRENGAFDAVVSDHWARGGQGAVALAEAVVRATHEPSNFKFLYDVKVLFFCFNKKNYPCNI